MAADNKSGSKPKPPSFYEAAASMSGGAGAGADGKAGAPGTDAGASGEKVKNVKVLLEVFGKMDQLEEDQAGKDMIRQMSDLAKQYQQKLEGGGDGKPAKSPSDGAPGAGAPGGAGAGAGGMGMGTEAGAVPA